MQLVLLALSPNALAKQISTKQKCEITECRKKTKIKLKAGNGSQLKSVIPKTPIYFNRWLNIVPGEKVHLQVDIDRNHVIKKIRYVKKPRYRNRTVTFELKQIPGVNTGEAMLLTVSNPFKKALKYRLYEYSVNSEDYAPRETCAVASKSLGYERWSHFVIQLLITDLRFVNQPTNSDC